MTLTQSSQPSLNDQNLVLIRQLITEQDAQSPSPSSAQIRTVFQLLQEGSTIPFIARYRKERTQGLDEVQLRFIESALKRFDELEQRRNFILKRLNERKEEGLQLAQEVFEAVKKATSLSLLEEIYTPYKTKRVTKADRAKEAGLEPLMKQVIEGQNWKDQAKTLLSKAYPTLEAIQEAVIELLAEHLASSPSARTRCLEILGIHLMVDSRLKRGAESEEVYRDYYAFSNRLRYLKPHQLLALRRGEKAGILSLKFHAEDEPLREWLLRQCSTRRIETHAHRDLLEQARTLAYENKLLPSVSKSLWAEALNSAEERSAQVFAQNLKSLLLSSPLLNKRVLGLDPGLRTGCKLAVINERGDLLKTALCYTHDQRATQASQVLAELIDRYQVDVIAIGNGTGSREAEKRVVEALALCRQKAQYAVVDEAGASVYSASDVARKEFPNLDVSERGAVSIARRLQDPLAELIKVDPQSVGVGMYQHDLNEHVLKECVTRVVEDAVCSVGADLNTASAELLTYIAGLGPSLAKRVVEYREQYGAFTNRKSLLKIKGLGAKTFEQCAGFLRVHGGDEPLDETAVHPEGYSFAKAVLKALKLKKPSAELAEQLQAESQVIQQLAEHYSVGQHTLKDRLDALTRPGRDPRDTLPPPLLRSKALSLNELETGMILQGSIRNVVDFGAFVDLGVKRDGLIHVSTLGHLQPHQQRINPHHYLKVGQVVEVCVTHIDQQRGRISLALT